MVSRISFFAVIFILIFSNCKKETEKENILPKCSILNSTDGELIKKGESISIYLSASDEDGEIVEVQYYLNDISMGTLQTTPYNFQINTANLDLGTHQLLVKAIDNSGAFCTDELSFELVSDFMPVANFETESLTAQIKQELTFTDLSENDPSSWNWDFGDGESSTEQHPTHKYIKAGKFLVTLIVGNSAGTDRKSLRMTINIVDIDGNEYGFVEIGDQIWLAENLKTTKYNDGIPIELVTDSTQWAQLESAAFCWYDNNRSFAIENNYGALYNWYTVNTEKLCPEGWHVPSIDDFFVLQANTEASSGLIGKHLKSETGWANNGNGEDKFGFAALPAGNRTSNGNFVNLDTGAMFWLNTLEDNGPRYWFLQDFSDAMTFAWSNYNEGASVRCIQN